MHINVEAGIVNFWCNSLKAIYLVFETESLRGTWANMWQHACLEIKLGSSCLHMTSVLPTGPILQPYLSSVTNKYIMMC